MVRYSRLQGTDDEEDDGLELILGQNSSGYVILDDLDEEGRPVGTVSQAQTAKQDKLLRRTPSGLMAVVFGVLALLLVSGVVFSHRGYRRHRQGSPTGLSNGTHVFNVSTLLISLDGFHPHYVSSTRTPVLHRMVEEQCAVPYMHPSFPTQTFPNHWTLVTGLEPMNHGIVGNTFMDPELGQFVNTDPSRSMNPKFWGGEPVWATVRRAGKRAGVHMWPGSEVDWKDGTPDYVSKFNASEPLDAKADHVISWFDSPFNMPTVMLAYVPTVDATGHQHGVAGSELISAIQQVDQFVGTILNAVKERNLSHIVNVVVVSDHGMAPTSDSRIAFLDDLIPMGNVSSRQGWPLAGLRLTKESDVSEMWKHVNRPWRGVKAYRNTGFPPEFHFSAHGKYRHRFAPMYLVPDLGWSIVTHDEWDAMGHTYNLQGVHGYDNREPLMRALFVAQGPAFPAGHYQPIRSTDVYSGVCFSVGVKPRHGDGHFQLRELKSTITEEYPGAPFGMDFLPDSTFEIFEPKSAPRKAVIYNV